MLIKQDIAQIADLLSKHGDYHYASYMKELSILDLDSMSFINTAGSGSVWGGAGSLIDVALCNSTLPIEVAIEDEKKLKELLGKLARHLVEFEYDNAHLPQARLDEGWLP